MFNKRRLGIIDRQHAFREGSCGRCLPRDVAQGWRFPRNGTSGEWQVSAPGQHLVRLRAGMYKRVYTILHAGKLIDEYKYAVKQS